MVNTNSNNNIIGIKNKANYRYVHEIIMHVKVIITNHR